MRFGELYAMVAKAIEANDWGDWCMNDTTAEVIGEVAPKAFGLTFSQMFEERNLDRTCLIDDMVLDYKLTIGYELGDEVACHCIGCFSEDDEVYRYEIRDDVYVTIEWCDDTWVAMKHDHGRMTWWGYGSTPQRALGNMRMDRTRWMEEV